MVFWSALGEELWAARTPIVLAGYLLVRALTPPLQRHHLRGPSLLLLGHLVAVAIAAGQLASGYDGKIADVASLSFELLAIVSLGTALAFRALLPRVGFTLPRILIDLVTAVGVIVVFIVVGNRAGFSVAGLITTSAVLTAVIGFSLQDTLGNVMGGLSIQLDRSVQVGDWITLTPGQPAGRVTEIRWRYTAVETRNWETVIIPNGTLVKSQVMILGRRIGEPVQWRRTVEFFVDFRTPPNDVIDAVQTALRGDPPRGVATEPQPVVLFFGVRDSFASYCVRYWLTEMTSDDGTDSAVRVRLWYALRRAGIEMSIPASTIFLTHETPERTARKTSEELLRRMRALGGVDLFRGLPEKQREELAGDLAFAPFAAGEAVCREGANDDGLYMIVDGEAAVRIGRGADERDVARLVPGQFFGEMSLMTGEARTASVIAATPLVCYRADKPAMQRLLAELPALADQIAEVLAVRRGALTAARDERDDARRSRIDTVKVDLLRKIRGFFNLNR